MRILLAEDDRELAMHIQASLGQAGYVVVHLADGER